MKSKGEDGKAEKEERLVEKLKKGILVGKRRAGPFASTPVRLWNTGSSLTAHLSIIANNVTHDQQEPSFLNTSNTSTVASARKLAAAIWEFQHYLPLSKMHRGVHSNGGAVDDPRLRRHDNRQRIFKDKGLDFSHFFPDPSPTSPDRPESAGSLRRHIAASVIQHHRSIEKSNHALQPVSPASYGSSMEMAPYNPAVTPSSSLDFKGRVGESHYSLKTSTELLKVLNRIWSLEEQHSSNMTLIKALKTELEHARIRVKELLRDQQADRHEIDDLMKQIVEDKLVRKSKEQDRLQAAIQALRGELEDERKLRKRSESLHRKIAQELSETKLSLSNALKEIERERKSKKLLEDLCDEFARGIKDYEQEVHALKHKSDKDWVGKDDADRLILHISESWLDERMQMRLEEAQHGFTENSSIVDKLGFEIETFLKAKRIGNSKRIDNMLPGERRKSLESVPLNEVASAPQQFGDEEDSAGSDSHCFELNKPSGDFNMHGDEAVDGEIDETVKSGRTKKKLPSNERIRGQNLSSFQAKYEQQMAWAAACNGSKKSQSADIEEGKAGEEGTTQYCEVAEGSSFERKNNVDELQGLNPNYVIDKLIRSHVVNDAAEASCSYPVRRNASPVRQWMAKLSTPDIKAQESSTKPPQGLRENTLKAKLMEARSKGQRSQLKIFKGSS